MEDYSEYYDDYEEDRKSKCRLCTTEEKSKYMINIFGSQGRKHALDIKIRKCLPVLVRNDDGMPKTVCMSCINKLDVSWELVESSLRAHNTFLSVMNHDPARAMTYGYVVDDDDNYDDEEDDYENVEDVDKTVEDMDTDNNCTGIDDNVSIVSSHQFDDPPVTIKEEPIYVEDIDSIDEIDWENKDKSKSAEEDVLSNIVVASVNSISKSPSAQRASPVITATTVDTMLPATEINNEIQQDDGIECIPIASSSELFNLDKNLTDVTIKQERTDAEKDVMFSEAISPPRLPPPPSNVPSENTDIPDISVSRKPI